MSFNPQSTTSPQPMVVLANGYRFVAGQVLSQARIESRAVLWCRSGQGEVEVNGDVFTLQPLDYLVLPWARRMVYRADAKRPFHLAAVHWIPSHARDWAMRWGVAHGPESELADAPGRKDRPLVIQGQIEPDAPATTHHSRLVEGDSFHQLLELVVTLARQGCHDEQVMARMGWLVEYQLAHGAAQALANVSHTTQLLMDFMLRHLDEPLDLHSLTREAGCSRATVLRLFRHELQTTPQRWLTQQRLTRAKQLLRSSARPVYEIARQVGFPDAAYFSKVFARHAGMPPAAYRHASMPV